MKSGRLLLADRHLGVLGGVHGLLHDLFDSVVMVADAQSLAEAVTDLGPDLVVMDLSLPVARKRAWRGGCWRATPACASWS